MTGKNNTRMKAFDCVVNKQKEIEEGVFRPRHDNTKHGEKRETEQNLRQEENDKKTR